MVEHKQMLHAEQWGAHISASEHFPLQQILYYYLGFVFNRTSVCGIRRRLNVKSVIMLDLKFKPQCLRRDL
jgi:hypothetical protein